MSPSSMSSPARQALRGVGAGRVFVGMVTLLAAGRDAVPILDSLPKHAVAAARVLAVRDLVQGASLALLPDNHVVHAARTGNAIDALHAASMLPLVIFSSRYRTAATLSVASALGWIALTAIARRP
jgi:hypothetical protein